MKRNPSACDLDRLRRSPLLGRVDWHPTLPSTNDFALELAARETLETPLLILADEQTAGRGRGVNRWWSGPGALTLSLVIDPLCIGPIPLRTEHWPRVALCAGVSLCEALIEVAPQVDCGLKWPNDVLISGRKVAGILVEVPPAAPPVPRRLVLGMGVNVNNSLADAPPDIQSAGIALGDATDLEFDATRVVLEWLSRFFRNLQGLAIDDPNLPRSWQSLCRLSGKAIELQAGERRVGGHCRGIDADGALLVETASGLERLFGGTLVRVST